MGRERHSFLGGKALLREFCSRVPFGDVYAYLRYPKHNYIYNKILVAESQNINCAPHGIEPKKYPVFCKPIYNLRGMGKNSQVAADQKTLRSIMEPGCFWMELLTGVHVSTDVVLVKGQPVWWKHATGIPAKGGMFSLWTIHAGPFKKIESYCGAWFRKHLKGYTGLVNTETIGGKMIEVHLRHSEQWRDLYGEEWMRAVVTLFKKGVWRYRDSQSKDAYSIPLFAPHHGAPYKPPSRTYLNALQKQKGILKITISFHTTRTPEFHSMPPGGFRLAVINCGDLKAGMEVKKQLARAFGVTPLV